MVQRKSKTQMENRRLQRYLQVVRVGRSWRVLDVLSVVYEETVIMKKLWLEADMETPQRLELPSGEVAVYSRRCPDKTSPNEDAALVFPVDEKRVVLAVADGCGGMAGGADASRIVLKAIKNSLARATEEDSLRSAILDGIELANAKVLKLGVGAATTLAVAIADGEFIRSFHIGDSRVVLVGSRGKIKLQTPTHSPVGYAVEAGILSETDAMTHEDLHIVSNVVGARDCWIEVGMRRKMANRDTLILGSDGVFDNLSVDEICDVIRTGPIKEAAEQLATRTGERIANDSGEHPNKPDDATYVLFRKNG